MLYGMHSPILLRFATRSFKLCGLPSRNYSANLIRLRLRIATDEWDLVFKSSYLRIVLKRQDIFPGLGKYNNLLTVSAVEKWGTSWLVLCRLIIVMLGRRKYASSFMKNFGIS